MIAEIVFVKCHEYSAHDSQQLSPLSELRGQGHRPVRSFVAIVIHQIYRFCACQHVCNSHDSK